MTVFFMRSLEYIMTFVIHRVQHQMLVVFVSPIVAMIALRVLLGIFLDLF